MKKTFIGMLCAALLAGCTNASVSSAGSTSSVIEDTEVRAEAPAGTYVGNDKDGVAEFLGIRYGVYEAYKAASDVTTTTADVIEAKEYGANCLQPYDEVEVASHDEMSADCLYLNIWTKDVKTEGKPVIVFIHGGSCIWGGTSDPTYSGEYFVRGLEEGEDCVFVTINYRMSYIGGLDLSVLEGYTDEYADAVNLSKLDQTQALKWVNENIEAFGGNPDNVTIMGQSAGGGAVEMLMADTDTHKYFNRAVVNSGAQAREALSMETFTENSRSICEQLGVTTVEELCALTDEQLYENMSEIVDSCGKAHPGLKPADGNVISKTWWEDLVNGAASDIDLLIGGTNGEEDWDAIDWDNSVYEPLTENSSILDGIYERDQMRGGAYGRYYSTLEDGFIEGYLAMNDDPVQAAMDLHNDAYFNYPTYTFASMQSENNANTWFYNWEYAPNMEEVLEYAGDDAEVSPWGRALHCTDLCFELGTKDGYDTLTGDPEKMSDDMIAKARAMVYYFAKTGNPNNDLIEEWLPYDTENRNSMLIGADGSWTNVTNYRKEVMDYMSVLTPYGVE